MANFLLVHASFFGAWCWDKTIPYLEAMGHHVTAIDLPGHGRNPADIRFSTLTLYKDSVVSALKQFSEPPILVGHSISGMTISAAGETDPNLIRKLIYLTAFVPRDGESLRSLGADGSHNDFTSSLRFSEDFLTCTVAPERLQQVFFNDCTEEDFVLFRNRLVPAATEPTSVVVHLTQENYGSIPRAYIETTLDATINIAMQRRMAQHADITEIYSLHTGHSPFLSRPEELAKVLAATASS